VWSTAFLALAIVGSYLFMATRFATIALDAQERLVNVRVGALQDSFVPLARIIGTSTDALSGQMHDLSVQNPTIRSIAIAERRGERWIIVAAGDQRLVGTDDIGDDFAFGLALQDRLTSFTIPLTVGSERLYKTVRFIDESATGPRISIITQTLSEADAQVSRSILESLGLFAIVLVLLLVLFFRHSRIIDYASLYRRLKEADSLKDDFLSMASHELRTPLTIIRGYAEELRGDLAPASRADRLERIDASAKDLDSLIADMLDVSRIEQGRMKYEPERIELAPALAAVCANLAARVQEKGLTLATHFPQGVAVTADKDRLRQIAINLVGNAIKYTKHGGITVVVRAEGDRAILEVQDTGLGMTADEQAHLFGKFYRAGGADVRAQTGTGLGLWITKQMIEAMHGTISVESIKDVGSKFIVSLPKA
jgi:signal transduction histidine kinase